MGLDAFQVCEDDLSEQALVHYAQEQAIAVDTETMGLKPQRDRLCLVQIADASGRATLVRLAKGITQAPRLKQLLENPQVEKVFHYARFDIAMLRYHLGIDTAPIFCTKIGSKLARTYTPHHGLKDLVRDLTQVELDKTAQSSDWGNVQALSEKQLRYAANDVLHLLKVRSVLQMMLEREGRWQLAQHCFHCLPTVVQLDLLGYEDIFNH
ncbi:ribonuclease D [Leptolyngbya sp. FACHB-261]|uniref:ribonuclease D n=1 Tax=Leptolyngbya sp. FACHB-261 TaxID=2692806 RepID=UPI001689D0E6|nr:ribonuclease D [Leptolyngbya sp. FACHB-261]MBD2100518.1 ribonuclease D [Leptolyngbya sp. FACHB-261]